MATRAEVNMNQLIPGEEYTFMYNYDDGTRANVGGIVNSYLAEQGNPRGAVRLSNYQIDNELPKTGPIDITLKNVAGIFAGRVRTQTAPPIQAPPAYREGMRPSERFMKHGWLAKGEKYIPAMHNPLGERVDVRNILNTHNLGQSIEGRNVNRNTNPSSNYYSPEEVENMRNQMKNVECPICLEPITDDRCRVCTNGHKFHLTHPGQATPIIKCPICMVGNAFSSCRGNYNDARNGGKKQKGNRKKSRKLRRKSRKPRRNSSRRRKSSSSRK
jgi:hypothetical protein